MFLFGFGQNVVIRFFITVDHIPILLECTVAELLLD